MRVLAVESIGKVDLENDTPFEVSRVQRRRIEALVEVNVVSAHQPKALLFADNLRYGQLVGEMEGVRRRYNFGVVESKAELYVINFIWPNVSN